MPLGILVSLDQQLDQAGDDGRLLERGMVGRAQGQVADQADGSLAERRGEGEICPDRGLEQRVLPMGPAGPPSHRIPSAARADFSFLPQRIRPPPRGGGRGRIDSSRAAGTSCFLH